MNVSKDTNAVNMDLVEIAVQFQEDLNLGSVGPQKKWNTHYLSSYFHTYFALLRMTDVNFIIKLCIFNNVDRKHWVMKLNVI